MCFDDLSWFRLQFVFARHSAEELGQHCEGKVQVGKALFLPVLTSRVREFWSGSVG